METRGREEEGVGRRGEGMVGGFDIRELVEEAKKGVGSVEKKEEPQTEGTSRLEELCSNIEQDSKAEEMLESLGEDAFYGAKKPSYVLQEEKPQHRVICYLAAEGNTRNEIAQKTGFHPVMIGYVLKQNWAQKRIAELIRQHGGDQVELALKGAVLDAAQLLIKTVRDPDCDIKVRSSNAKEILDRVYGKSQQVITNLNLSAEDLSDDELAKQVRPAIAVSSTVTQ